MNTAIIKSINELFERKFATIEEAVDALAVQMSDLPEMLIDCPLDHVFTPGLYTRTIYMPTGSLLVSRTHQTTHQFFIMRGSAWVFTEENGWELLEAGRHGVTIPGTRRLLYIVDDCVWSTAHSVDYVVGNENVDKETELDMVSRIEADILDGRDLKILEK